jgi:hypothetical protein
MSKSHLVVATVILTLGLLTAVPALAWGPEGHAIVADIATAHLTPAAQAQVSRLLALESHQSLDQVASWADAVRPARPATAPWHFVDIPLTAEHYDPSRDCQNDDCVIARIVSFTELLTQSRDITQTRLDALKWVVHFVGDAHQPLHAEDNNHDKGGNTISLTYFGAHKNLHSIWDTTILEQGTGLREGPNFTIDLPAVQQVAKRLDASIDDQQRQAWAPSGMLVTGAKPGVWASSGGLASPRMMSESFGTAMASGTHSLAPR